VLGSDGRWHFTGGCEPRPPLDDAWFGESAKSAALIVSMCFGLPDGEPGSGGAWADVLDYQPTPGSRYCRLNSTKYYRHTGWLDFSAAGALHDTTSGEQRNVIVSIFNYGALRSICKVPLNASGSVSSWYGDYA
jgi:hypothetical protein